MVFMAIEIELLSIGKKESKRVSIVYFCHVAFHVISKKKSNSLVKNLLNDMLFEPEIQIIIAALCKLK